MRLRKRVIGGDAVDQRLVHADVDDVGAVLDLLAGDGDGLLVVAGLESLANFGEPVTLVRSPIMRKRAGSAA